MFNVYAVEKCKIFAYFVFVKKKKPKKKNL